MRDRLYRSRDDRVLFGVCGGMAEWLDLDPSLVRIVFALLVITGGVGLLLYIIAALVVPEEPLYRPMPPAGFGGAPESTMAGAPAADAPSEAIATGTSAEPVGAAPAPGGYQPSAWMTDREARRAARRAARAEGRAARDGRVGLIFGAILVIVGIWFLVRRYLPSFDTDFLGPVILIGIGAIVLAGALSRNGEDDPAKRR